MNKRIKFYLLIGVFTLFNIEGLWAQLSLDATKWITPTGQGAQLEVQPDGTLKTTGFRVLNESTKQSRADLRYTQTLNFDEDSKFIAVKVRTHNCQLSANDRKINVFKRVQPNNEVVCETATGSTSCRRGYAISEGEVLAWNITELKDKSNANLTLPYTVEYNPATATVDTPQSWLDFVMIVNPVDVDQPYYYVIEDAGTFASLEDIKQAFAEPFSWNPANWVTEGVSCEASENTLRVIPAVSQWGAFGNICYAQDMNMKISNPIYAMKVSVENTTIKNSDVKLQVYKNENNIIYEVPSGGARAASEIDTDGDGIADLYIWDARTVSYQSVDCNVDPRVTSAIDAPFKNADYYLPYSSGMSYLKFVLGITDKDVASPVIVVEKLQAYASVEDAKADLCKGEISSAAASSLIENSLKDVSSLSLTGTWTATDLTSLQAALGTNSPVINVESVVLTDGVNFTFTVPFTADAVSYTRSLPVSRDNVTLETICLPYETPVPDGCTVRRYTGSKEATVNFETVTGSMEANTPYLFSRTADVSFGATNVSITPAPVTVPDPSNVYIFKGTYEGITGSSAQNKYLSNGTSFAYSVSGASIAPFRAYLEKVSGQNPAPALLSIGNGGGGTTGLETVDATSGLKIYATSGGLIVETVEARKLQVYTMDGCLIYSGMLVEGNNHLHLTRGIYLIDNKKVIVK